MTHCPKCQHELLRGAVECPFCGIVLHKYRAPAPPTPGPEELAPGVAIPRSHPQASPPPGAWPTPPAAGVPTHAAHGTGIRPPPPAELDADPPWWKRRSVALVALLVVGGALTAWALWPTRFPRISLQAAASNRDGKDPCEARQRCVVVLMAPWCKACNASIPLVKDLAQRWSGSYTIGIKPVISMAKVERCEKMAEKLGIPSFVDPSAKLAKALGTKMVPTWVVVDLAGKVRKKSTGTVLNLPMQIERLGLAKLDETARAPK